MLLLSLTVNLALLAVLGIAAVRRLRPPPAAGDRAYRRDRVSLHAALAAGPATRDVVLIGDSLTDRGEWDELLGRAVANRGVAGDRVADVAARLDSALGGAPRVVVLEIGVNDLLAGRDPAAVAEEHARLVAALRARRPETRIAVTAILPVNERLLAATGDALSQRAIDETNRRLERAAAAAGADWLDPGPRLRRGDGQLDERYTADGVHLDGDGYRQWAAVLAAYLADGTRSGASGRARP